MKTGSKVEKGMHIYSQPPSYKVGHWNWQTKWRL